MHNITLPDPKTYPSEGSEVGDVAVGMQELALAYKKVFPDHLEQFNVWPRSWHWQAMDSCFKLQWLAEQLLDNKQIFQGTFQQDSHQGTLRIELQGLVAKNEDDEDTDRSYWNRPVSGLRLEFQVGPTFLWMETRSAPATWMLGTDPDAPAQQTFYFSEWSEEAEHYANFILIHFFDGEFVKDAIIGELPVVAIEDEEHILPLWNCLWAQRGFSGIGSDSDFVNHSSVLHQLAYSADKAWMKFLVQGSEHALYNNGYSPQGILTNGDFQAIENMHTVTVNTPDGQVKYDFDDMGWISKGELTLDGEPIKFTDPRFSQWMALIEKDQWQWAKDEQ